MLAMEKSRVCMRVLGILLVVCVTGEVGYPKVLGKGADVRCKTREGDGGQIAREERSICQRRNRIEYKRH
jgi:hypothetical protein